MIEVIERIPAAESCGFRVVDSTGHEIACGRDLPAIMLAVGLPEAAVPEDLYCKIYVDAPIDKEALKQVLLEISGGRLVALTVTTDFFELSVFRTRPGALCGLDDFLYWPYYLEIEPVNDGTDEEVYMSALASMIRELEARGFGAVPSCSFEDRLQSRIGKGSRA